MDVSILVPTFSWTEGCEDIYNQLEKEDELVLICDSKSDPLLSDKIPNDVKILISGEPENCSGKCNALSKGLEKASREYVICTDADFRRSESWLGNVKKSLEKDNLVTAPNFFQSREFFGKLLEPGYLIGIVLGLYSGSGVWGGLMAFNKNNAPTTQIIDNLRKTVSDDILIGKYFKKKTVTSSNFGVVPIEGNISDILNMSKRFGRSIFLMDPKMLIVPLIGISIYLVALTSFPFLSLLTPILVAALLYAKFRIKRWTFLLAPISIFLISFLTLWGAFHEKIDWNDRKYLWRGKFEVEVLD